mgnify:CR=1 FL=1
MAITKEDRGVTSPMEAIIAFSIIISVIALSFFAITNMFSIYQREDTSMHAMAVDIIKKLVSSPGSGEDNSTFWEDSPDKVEVIGLALPEMVEGYIRVNLSDPGSCLLALSTLQHFNKNTCFVEGTPILMENGSYKNIEDIKVGDKVLSLDQRSGRLKVGVVRRVYRHENTPMYILINDGLGVTPNHLILTKKGWKKIDHLMVGDTMYNGEIIYSLRPVFKTVTTYDLEVYPYHNYIVKGIVSHNTNVTDLPPIIERDIPVSKIFAPLTDLNHCNYSSYHIELIKEEKKGNYTYRVYYIKKISSTRSLYPILDWRKIIALTKVPYEKAKSCLGLDGRYNFLIKISLFNGTVIEYPPKIDLDNTKIMVSHVKNVIIFSPYTLEGNKLLYFMYGDLIPKIIGSYQFAQLRVTVYR